MPITHVGTLSLAADVVLPAVVCPDAAADLVGILPMLNTNPDLSLAIEAAAARAQVCRIWDTRTNSSIFEIRERFNVLPFQLSPPPVQPPAGLAAAATPNLESDPCMEFVNFLACVGAQVADPVAILAVGRKCEHGNLSAEYDAYRTAHELYGHEGDVALKRMLANKVVYGGPVNLHFPPKPLPRSTCLEANISASKTPPLESPHRQARYPGQFLRIDNLGPLSPTGRRLLVRETKGQTALQHEVIMRRAHRSAAPRGGTQHLEIQRH
jgi:hypothetical protein